MKKKIIIGIIIIVVILIIVSLITQGGKGPEYVTAIAEIGSVEQTVDATGSVESSQAIDLNFKTTGKITSMNVKAGDKVRAGQTLATLDTAALNSKVDDAQSALLEAQANLDKLLAGSTPEDIRIDEITVEQKKQDLIAAENNLENLKASRDIELYNLKKTTVVKFNNELIVAEASLEIIDNTLKNDDAQDTLSLLNIPALEIAQNAQKVAINSVDDAKVSIAQVDENSSDQAVMNAIGVVEDALDNVRDCLSYVFDVLENTITSNELSQSELDGLIADIQGEQSSISTSKTNLQTAEANWTNKQVYYLDQITKGEDAVAAAQDDVNLAEAQLALSKAEAQDYEIEAEQARVAKAQANLSLALANLGDVIITAPVSGTITEINNKIGEQTSLSEPVIQMIGESELEIEVDIPESDIAKLETGQLAEITLDSFGDDDIFAGRVTFIDPAETVIQDVVYYEVKVQFDDAAENVKPGMTANVIIKTAVKNNVVRVPLRAVKQRNDNKVVEVLVNKQVEKKQVTTGLRGDNYIEITSGLAEGEEVVTFVKNEKQ